PSERRPVRARLRYSGAREIRHGVGRELRGRCEAPRTVHERADSDTGGFVVTQALNASLARLDSLRPIPTDPDVGVLGAGVLRGADPGHDQLFIVGRLRRAAADKYLWRGTESIGASADGSQRDRGPRGAHELPTGYRHVNSGSWG